ncbi:hypothetical protein I9X38_06695 [Bacillus mojavensis]|nr:hypothetical protein I9X38_06695 [Bacillus mojavensis]
MVLFQPPVSSVSSPIFRNGSFLFAIVAGANLLITSENYNSMEQAGMLSADGKCYAFDKRANGMVPAEAVAVIVLKKLSKAESDGNPVYATCFQADYTNGRPRNGDFSLGFGV